VANVDTGVFTIGELKRRVAGPARQYGLKKVYLFGSYARGEATPKSDIDLCIDDSNIHSLFELSGLFLDMEEALMNKDAGIVCHILSHISNIVDAENRFGNDIESLKSNIHYFNSVCMGLLQIGELSNHFSDGFTSAHNDIPWRKIVALHNIVVHGYGELNINILWDTIKNDIPELEKKLKDILNEKTQKDQPMPQQQTMTVNGEFAIMSTLRGKHEVAA
jgi:uncharacterized protein with HEPN domain